MSKKSISPNKLRKIVLEMVYTKKSGHIGGSFSIAEAICALYNNFDIPDHDKLILSKGHAVPIMYAALYAQGKLPPAALESFREINSPLQGHPDQLRLPLVTATTGSLGQGLSIAAGHAMACKMQGSDAKIFCIIGDGELQEGQVYEAIRFAGEQKLDNLVCILDNNKFGSENQTIECPVTKTMMTDFHWNYWYIANGHSEEDITTALKEPTFAPLFIKLNTIKGAGVSFMQGNNEWHSAVPNEEQYKQAMKELS